MGLGVCWCQGKRERGSTNSNAIIDIPYCLASWQDSVNLNTTSQARAGRLLGRCHARRGEHALSVSALDAAAALATTGHLLLATALTVRARALVGKAAEAAASGSVEFAPHWDEHTGRERVVEVMGRMAGDKALLEKLLLHGL